MCIAAVKNIDTGRETVQSVKPLATNMKTRADPQTPHENAGYG